MIIDIPLLIIGHGPAALVAAKVVSGAGMTSLIAGHEPFDDPQPVELAAASLAILEPHGVLGVLRPYATAQDPFSITPTLFEQGLKHHCVVDMLITVYDGMTFTDAEPRGQGVTGRLTDGRSSWTVEADAFLDVSGYPTDLDQSIQKAGAFGQDLLARLT